MQHFLTYLQKTIDRCWQKPGLCNYRGESFTYGEVATEIEKFHLFFENISICKGDKIAICSKNSARWGISFLSVVSYPAVAVPLLSDFLPDSVASLVDHSDSVAFFCDPDIWKNIDIASMPKVRAVISTDDFSILYGSEEVIAAANDRQQAFLDKFAQGFRPNYPVDNFDDVAVINYTSGTTSAPKGVMLTYKNLSSSVDFGETNIPIMPGNQIVSMLPMGHIYGLVYEFLYPFCNGCPVFYFGKTPSPTLLMKAMKEIRPFMIVTVPLVMEKIYKSSIKPVLSKWYMEILTKIPLVSTIIYHKIGARIMDAFGGNVRIIIMGGAALSPRVERCFKRLRLPYTVGYGMTEAAPLLAYLYWEEYKPGSCGKAITGVDVKIDSDDSLHIAGEILAKGDNITIGYYKNPEANALSFTSDGYLRTGDLGIVDKNGNIFIKGRCKTMILSANGQNIYPEEIEAIINGHSYVAESVVVDRSSKLVALVYLDDAAIKRDKLDAEAIADIPENIRLTSNSRLPGYSKITKVEVVLSPFEKTPKMSIKRFLYS